MKRYIMLIILILIPAVLFTGCNDNEEVNMIPIDKMLFARNMSFNFSLVIDGERRTSSWEAWSRVVSPTPDPLYTELIFVHNEEEAQNFPDNVIAAWPIESLAPGVIAGLYWYVSRDESDLISPGLSRQQLRPVITFEQFGLSYPLTVEDLVDNWEKVFELWNNLLPSEQHGLVVHTATRAREIEEMAQEQND